MIPHKLKPFDFRIFPIEIINVDDEYIEFKLKDKSDTIKTNVIAQFGLNSFSNFQPIKPKKGDKIFVFFENGNEQFPVAILTGRCLLKDIDKEKMYIRAPIIHFNIDKTKEDQTNFVQFNFKDKTYKFNLNQCSITMNSNNIKINTPQTFDLSANTLIKLTSGTCSITIMPSGIILKGATMTLGLSGNWEIRDNLIINFENTSNLTFNFNGQNQQLTFDFGGQNQGLVLFEKLKLYINTLISSLKGQFDSHIHPTPSGTSGTPTLPLVLQPLSDDVKSQKIILKE